MRSVPISTLVARARRYADQEYTPFVSDDPELLDYLNVAYGEYYDLLVMTSETYYTKLFDISLTTGQTTYDLPEDFYKSTSLSYKIADNQYYTIRPYMEAEKNNFGMVTAVLSGTVQMRYVPLPEVFTSLDDGNVIEDMTNWTDYISTHMAIQMLNKGQEDTAALERKLVRLEARIKGASQNIDQLMPFYTTDIYRVNPYGFAQSLRYRFISGDQVSIISTSLLGWGSSYGFGY
jgi:hypothetical protein